MPYTKQKSLLTWGTSSITSPVIFIGDADRLSVSLLTTAASVVTLQGSNADGFTDSLPANEWSTLTALTGNGIYAVQPGARWFRALQAASSSSATVVLALHVDT